MADYMTVTCRLSSAAEDDLAAILGTWPVLGCHVEDPGDGGLAVTVYLDEAHATSVGVVVEGLVGLGGRDVSSASFADRDWLAEYRRAATPRRIGTRFWVDPSPESPTAPPDGRIHLVIEPRQAFGTGSHESTALVLLLLESLDLGRGRVLDVGTGSGILAIAARALGATWVMGCDVDQDAVFIASQTVAQQPSNRPTALLAGSTAALRAPGRFDVVLANMLPHQFVPLLGELAALVTPEGVLVLSGLMADQRVAVEAELATVGLASGVDRRLGEWIALVCTRVRA